MPTKRQNPDNLFLKQLGRHIEQLILSKGYKSAYDFWVRKAGDHISRATLNYILAGETDPKISTLRLLAKLLKVSPNEVFDFSKTRKSSVSSNQSEPVRLAPVKTRSKRLGVKS